MSQFIDVITNILFYIPYTEVFLYTFGAFLLIGIIYLIKKIVYG